MVFVWPARRKRLWEYLARDTRCNLKCAKLTVSGVSQTGHDIANVIQGLIERRHVDVDVGVRLGELEQAVGSRDNTDIGEARDIAPLQDIDGIDGGSTCCQHRIYGVGNLEINFVRELIIVLHGLQGMLIAPQAKI